MLRNLDPRNAWDLISANGGGPGQGCEEEKVGLLLAAVSCREFVLLRRQAGCGRALPFLLLLLLSCCAALSGYPSLLGLFC